MGAFSKDNKTGKYKINFDKFQNAVDALSEDILTIQGDGDYERAAKLVKEKAVISKDLQADLDGLRAKGIPVDVVFEQGKSILGV